MFINRLINKLPHLPIQSRNTIKWFIRLLAAIGIVIGFISFPPHVGGVIGVILPAITLLLERSQFVAHILHVMPFPSDYLLQKRIGSVWGTTDYKNQERIFFGQIFETKKAAQEAYRLFKSWNFDKYIDTENNIVIRIVREDLDRYTILLHPGERGIKEYWQESVKSTYGKRVNARVSILYFWFITYADYWGKPKMLSIVESFKESKSILLNAFYVNDGQVEAIAKRHLVVSKIIFKDRKDIKEDDLEFHVNWEGPWIGVDREKREKFEPIFRQIEQGQQPISEE